MVFLKNATLWKKVAFFYAYICITLIEFMKFAVCIFFFLSAYSSYSQLTQIIGDPGVNEFAHAVTADDSGNAYLAGGINNDASVTCVSSTGSVLWTKTFDFPGTTSLKNEVGFIDIIGDTLFGCGWFTSGSSLQGAFIIKMNKNTGDIYWSKHDFTGDFYYSTIRYYNGQYFVVGADYVASGTAHDGKVFCLNSLDGSLVWQSQKFGLGFPTNLDYIDDFATMSEVVNGKFFIPGRSYPNGGSSNINMRVTLTGFDVAGNMICSKYLLFPESSPNNHRYYGLDVDFDGPDSLLVTFFGDDNCSGSCANFIMGMAKTDLNGNISFAKQYDVSSSGSDYLRGANVTSDAYVVYGGLNFTTTQNKQVVFKTDKSGNLLLAREIGIPGGILPIVSGTNNQAAGSVFKNGIHYFCSSKHNGNSADRDYLLIRLDEDLNSINPCFDFNSITIVESSLPTFSGDLSPLYQSHTVNLENGINDVDYAFNNTDCSISDIAYNQTTYGCDSVMIDIVSASGITYDITWSSGDTGFGATFYSSDSVIIEYYNPTNCCFMTDTIDYQLGTSTLDLNMPNDTSVCINSGGTFLIEPEITNCGSCAILWSDNSTDPTLLVSTTGWYSVEVSNSCGAVLLDSTFVELNLNPTISSISDTVVCSSDFPLTYNFAGSNVDSILWSNGDTNFSTTYLDSGSMQVVAYSQCGNLTENFSISIPDNFTLDMPNDTSVCINSGGTFLIDPIITNCNGCAILWSDNSTDSTLLVSATGWYSVELSNSCGYLLEDSILVELNLNPTITPISDTIVCSSDFPLTYNFTGSNVDSILWSNGDTNFSTTYLDSGSMQVVAYSQCGDLTENFSISIPDNFTLDMPNDTTLCIDPGETFLIDPIITNCNGCAILWSDNSTDSTLLVSATGWYSVELSNSCGYLLEDSILVELNLNPTIVSINDTVVCSSDFPLIYNFAGSNVDSILWSNGDTNFSTTYVDSGSMQVVAYSQCGNLTENFSISIPGNFTLDMPNDTTLCIDPGETFLIDPIITNCNGCDIIWSDNSTNPFLVVSSTGWYSVEVSNACDYVLEGSIFVNDTCIDLQPEVVAPNVFTPNGDASNPFFTLRTVNIAQLELVIINRWGNVMYSANQDLTQLNSFIGWDGRTSSGAEAKEGTYFYIYKAITSDGSQLEGHGFLQLVRD